MMRRISVLERSLGQLAFSRPTSHVCRSCRLQTPRPQQQQQQHRQIQTSTQQRAANTWGDRLKTTLFGKSDKDKQAAAAETAVVDSDVETTTEEQVDSSEEDEKKQQVVVPVDSLDDPNYIEATTWKGLERVGSASWVEDQRDPYDSYKG